MAKMHEATERDIRRAAAVVTVQRGRVPLPRDATDYLGATKGSLFLKVQKEILLTPSGSARASVVEIKKGAVALPEQVCSKLRLEDGALVAMVRRKDAVALKRATPEVVAAARVSVERVPQVAAITRCSAAGRLALKANVRKPLGSGPLYLQTNGEVVLTTQAKAGSSPVAIEKNRLVLPADVIDTLGLEGSSQVALVGREGGVAIKRFELAEREGEDAQAYDIETASVLTRVAETNPSPEAALERLTEAAQGARLKHNPRAFLKSRETLDAWRARRTLECSDTRDKSLRKRFVRERLDAQRADGSWEGETVLTVRMLRELAELRVRRSAPEVVAAVEWLLQRRETDLEPGFFLLSDDLAGEMERIYEAREKGSKERFRKGHSQFPTAELELAMKGDDLVRMPCGPRVTWPNAYVLEAMIALGHEEHPRVARSMGTLMNGGWCECGHQGHRPRETVLWSTERIEERERELRGRFRLGGIPSLEELARMDLSKTYGLRMPRTGSRRERGRTVYPLQMPCDFSPCGLIPIRAMARARDRRIRKFAEANLWELVVKQNGRAGRGPGWDRYYCGYAGLLQVFAAFDHLAATIGIMKWIPWMVEAQNPDGSWGEEAHRDAATFAVVSALHRVRDRLPGAFIPTKKARP